MYDFGGRFFRVLDYYQNYHIDMIDCSRADFQRCCSTLKFDLMNLILNLSGTVGVGYYGTEDYGTVMSWLAENDVIAHLKA